MVCDRCLLTVSRIFDELKINLSSLKLGEAVTDRETIPNSIFNKLKSKLSESGFEIIEDKNEVLVNSLKLELIKLARSEASPETRQKLSEHITKKFNRDYNSLAAIFSEMEMTTIGKYFIAQKVEYVKELLEYGELTLSEIAYRLGYSSVSHLSSQFKQLTGITPSAYKISPKTTRQPLDKV